MRQPRNKTPSISSPASLRIAVLGVGNIGSTFAFHLANAGHHDVTVIARPNSDRLRHLQRDKGIVNSKGERAEVRVTDTLDEETSYDLIIVTLLAHPVDAILPALQRSVSKCIQFMFNTFEPERLQSAIGAERCAFGMPFVQALVDKDGKLKATIGSVISMRRGGGASWHDSMVLAHGVQECFALIKGLGYPMYPREKAWMNSSPIWVVALFLWFMSRIPSFRELLATGINECHALVSG